MEKETNQNNSGSSNLKLYFSVFWIISIILVGGIAFIYGKTSSTGSTEKPQKVLASTNQISPEPTASLPTEAPAQIVMTNVTPVPNNKACSKFGLAQKWEYLTPYVVKQNDTLESIALQELKDSTRSDEIIKINGVGPFVVGYTIYLPPSSVSKSSGNLKQIYGKLVDRNSSSWQINLSSDPKGQGILIPAFLFESVANKDTFKIGDCLKIFLDDGYKIFTVSQQ